MHKCKCKCIYTLKKNTLEQKLRVNYKKMLRNGNITLIHAVSHVSKNKCVSKETPMKQFLMQCDKSAMLAIFHSTDQGNIASEFIHICYEILLTNATLRVPYRTRRVTLRRFMQPDIGSAFSKAHICLDMGPRLKEHISTLVSEHLRCYKAPNSEP